MRGLMALLLAGCVSPPVSNPELRLMTLNIANGAGDRFRTDEVRSLQSAESLAAHNLEVRSTRGIEPRSVLVVRLARAGAPVISVLTTHLETGSEAALRAAQLSAALAIAEGERQRGRRVVLLGDLNMALSDSTAPLADAGFTHAAGESIDQIWVDASLSTRDAEEQPTGDASDHPVAPTVTLR